jgi:tRNA A37 threonylcarbamoyladenosine dehydratase
MTSWQERTKILLDDNFEKINSANILIVGLGGVGGIATEMLCRAGIGKLTIVDADTIHVSNINRQIYTHHNVVGLPKTDVLGDKLLQINPDLKLTKVQKFLKDDEILDLLASEKFDYVVDAIDTLSPKVFLLYNAINLGLRIVSSMGAGGKLDASMVKVADISKSFGCPLARIVRKRLHRLGIYKGIKVVFSPEKINTNAVLEVNLENKKTTHGTISYLPNIFGIYAANVVINDLINEK